jgi:hypothetical protein
VQSRSFTASVRACTYALPAYQYPDVIALARSLCTSPHSTRSFIMDAEIVAVDPRDGALKTFQELSNRARKDVHAASIEVAVCVFAFDLMYLDGTVRQSPFRSPGSDASDADDIRAQVLLAQPFRQRRDLLRTRFPSVIPDAASSVEIARFDHVRSIESSEGREAVEAFWQESVDSKSEGLMIKVCILRCLAYGRTITTDGHHSCWIAAMLLTSMILQRRPLRDGSLYSRPTNPASEIINGSISERSHRASQTSARFRG